jgi:hypothetical protein
MPIKTPIAVVLLTVFSFYAIAQNGAGLRFTGATKANRNLLYRNIVQRTITGNLSLPLNADTEENWADAFGGMELLHFHTPWTDGRIQTAFDSIEKRSPGFQRALLELAYANFPGRFPQQAKSLLKTCSDTKAFAMCAEYLLQHNEQPFSGLNLEERKRRLVRDEKDEAIMKQLLARVNAPIKKDKPLPLAEVLGPGFLPNHRIVYSLQRKDRNYPGIALVRDSAGRFARQEDGSIFWVPQLARSINNLPGYLTNGNTPQGIFRMYGFDTSKTYFIGPTTNIQLTMPYEASLRHFFGDSTITDTTWTEAWYSRLLPPGLRKYREFYESFYAGKAGRTEIIAHGSTVDPEYYAGQNYYPITPTMGCLCTMETWSTENGERLDSDQQRLVNAVIGAGGPDGYCVVIEIDDGQQPVSINQILPLLKQ